MNIKLIYLAKKSPLWLEKSCADYTARFQNEWGFESVCIRPIDPLTDEKKIRALFFKKNFFLTVLDEKGKSLNSVEFSNFLKNTEIHFQKLCFVIGGAEGLSESIKKDAHFLLRLSSLTLPHALARLILCEQIYRAYTLLKNLPYHRA